MCNWLLIVHGMQCMYVSRVHVCVYVRMCSLEHWSYMTVKVLCLCDHHSHLCRLLSRKQNSSWTVLEMLQLYDTYVHSITSSYSDCMSQGHRNI